MGVALKRGRDFTEHDIAGAPLTVIINETLARLFWPAYPNGLDPVGQRILIGLDRAPVQVVGVAADMHQVLEKDPQPAIFRPLDQYLAQFPIGSAALLVRAAGDPRQFVNAVRNQVMAIDRDQPISAVQTMEELIAAEGGQRRVILMLLGCFAAGALVLAVIGIYGVIAQAARAWSAECRYFVVGSQSWPSFDAGGHCALYWRSAGTGASARQSTVPHQRCGRSYVRCRRSVVPHGCIGCQLFPRTARGTA